MVASIKTIEKYFREYNKLYFNNKLPLCQFYIHTSFDYLGYFHCYKNIYKPGKYHRMSISMSDRFDYTEDEFRKILVHEMIHLYLVHTKSAIEGNLDHGPLFIKTMNEFNKKFNLGLEVVYYHDMKRAPYTSRLLWWWKKMVG
jgi:hypothetical protein